MSAWLGKGVGHLPRPYFLLFTFYWARQVDFCLLCLARVLPTCLAPTVWFLSAPRGGALVHAAFAAALAAIHLLGVGVVFDRAVV